MKRLALWFACAACGIAAGAVDVQAQPLPSRPTFSPYLNLTRQGGTPALNYYGLVRPEQQFRQSIQTLQGAATANQQAIGDIQTGGGLPATGHPTQFLNNGSLNSGSQTRSFGSPNRSPGVRPGVAAPRPPR
jgi:hypothetical protein